MISVSNLTFAHRGSYDNIFENVSFQIDTDWKLGFTGRNGRGKTTFLNLLLGRYEYKGAISSPCGFEYFPFEVPDESLPTAAIVERICPGVLEWQLSRELALLETDGDILQRAFGTLSYGEKTKVLLAALFLKKNRFLLIDEPTNHLDMRGREIVSGYLKGKKGFIVVSHDRAFLDGAVDHILSINKAGIEVQSGNFSSWWTNKERRDSFETAENEKLKKEIKRLEKSAREKADWSDKAEGRKIGFDPSKTEKSMGRRAYEGAKSKKMMKRSKVIETRQQAAIEQKSKLLKNIESADTLKIFSQEYHSKRFVTLDDVSVFYGDKAACRHVSLTIEKGDRIALQGRNGSGKSSIIKLICGEELTYTGNFRRGSRLVISYVSQDTSGLSGSLPDYIRENGLDESLFLAMLRQLDISRVQFDKNLSEFSGGQKKKVLIAKSMCERAHLLVWDEPLNYIDVISRMQIEELILSCEPTILFVEHDAVFCDSVSTKSLLL